MDKLYAKVMENKNITPEMRKEWGVDKLPPQMRKRDVVSGQTEFIRKENDLNNDEKQFLLAVERGDTPKVRSCLEETSVRRVFPCKRSLQNLVSAERRY